jgi:hypothetical protein
MNIKKLSKYLAVPALVAGLAVPALKANAATPDTPHQFIPHSTGHSVGSSPNAAAVSPDVNGATGYYYATAFDSGNASGHPGTSIKASFYGNAETVPNSQAGNHSLTETWVQDKNGNAVEIGEMTDPDFWGTNNPVLFATSWTAGHFNGYAGRSTDVTGFVSTSSTVKAGVTQPPIGSYTSYQIVYSGGQIQFFYAGHEFGYIPGSFFSGGYQGNHESQTYAETYNGVSGGALPTMNGGVESYNAGGPTLNDYGVSTPYKIHSETPTSFSFSGPA